MVRVCVILVLGAVSLPLLAGTSSAGAAASRAMPPIGSQLAELKGSNTVAGDYFGDSVAISGTTVLVGAFNAGATAGRAYVFSETAKGWKQVAELKGSNTAADDYFGYSVAISGATAVVGAPGHNQSAGRAYVFSKTATGWHQVAQLKGSDTAAGAMFGSSVAISGTTAVVGAWGAENEAGRAYVFSRTAKGWEQVAELKATAYDSFGVSVAISGATVLVGARGTAGGAGRGYVFTKTAQGWRQVAEVKGSDTVATDAFGSAVALSGTTAVLGAPHHGVKLAGRAYVFSKTSTGWNQVAELTGSDTGVYFGWSVAVSGTSAVVGAVGQAYVFAKTATGWHELALLKGSDSVTNDYFGCAVAISGTAAVVGAAFHAKDAGRAYVFEA